MARPVTIYQQKNTGRKYQRGGALLVMVVILVMGITTAFVVSLSQTSIMNNRHQATAEALAKAKDALIGYAVSDPNRPGELPCPDIDGNGSADSCSFATSKLVGQLPWRTLDLPDPRDGAAEKLWYIVSENYRTGGASAIYSDTPGTISINGTNGYAAVVLAPGAPLPDQSRPAAPTDLNLSAIYLQFLENITQTTVATQAPNDIPGGAYTYNDQMISVRPEDFIPLVERRIAREAKKCLDSYAAASANKYPWAAPISPLGYTSVQFNKFGRIPDIPRIDLTTTTTVPLNSSNTSDPDIQALFNALAAVATARANCLVSDNATNTTAMMNAGAALEAIAETVKDKQPTVPAIPSSVTDPAKTAGEKAQQTSPTRCWRVHDGSSVLLESNLAAANTALNGITTTITTTVPEDASMQPAWHTGCFISGDMAGYWPAWKHLVLYQVSNGYGPNTAVSCGGTCLNISGSGNPNAGSGTYRAAIALAGKKIGTQTREAQTIDQYLDGANQTAPSSLNFVTYKPADTVNYSGVNDLVLCLDGKVNCK